MRKIRIIAFVLAFISILLACSACTIKFHFTTDPSKFDWYIDHYYVPTSEEDESGHVKYDYYSSEVTICNPFKTAQITDAKLSFGEGNTVTFVDLNGNTHIGTYDIPAYSKIAIDDLVLNFDDGTSIKTHYFKLKRIDKTNRFIVFTYDDVKYVFGINRTFTKEEIEQKTHEMAEWARKINTGYKLTEEEEDLDFFICKTVGLIGYLDRYINHTLKPSISPSIMRQRQDGSGEFYCEIKGKTNGFWLNDFERYVFILVDKNNNIKEIEEPIPGNCLCVRASPMYYFYFFE